MTSVDECIELIASDSRNALAWLNLGAYMQRNSFSHVNVVSKTYSPTECYTRAAELDPALSSAYFNLGLTLPTRGSTVDIGTVAYTREALYARAVELDDSNAEAWLCLGCDIVGNVVIHLEVYNEERCFLRAVELNETLADAWYNLAISTAPQAERTVLGERYTRRTLLVKALTHDSHLSEAWQALGASLADGERVAVRHGITLSKEECLLASLKQSPNLATSWYLLAGTIKTPVVVGDRTYTPLECYVEALRCDDHVASAWCDLSATLSRLSTTCIVGGEVVGAKEAAVRAVDRAATLPHGWYNLGVALVGDDRVTVGGKAIDRRLAFARALEIDDGFTSAWHNVAVAMRSGDTVRIGSREFSREQCLAKASQQQRGDSATAGQERA